MTKARGGSLACSPNIQGPKMSADERGSIASRGFNESRRWRLLALSPAKLASRFTTRASQAVARFDA